MPDQRCDVCNRTRITLPEPAQGKPIAVLVQHGGYGCDTGCCGHFIVVEREDGYSHETGFEFMHDFDDLRARAQHVADHLGVPFNEQESEFVDD